MILPSSVPLDVYYDYIANWRENGWVTVQQVPTGAAFGPIRVTTAGGSSTLFPTTFTGVTATATSGTPADALQASANPGQAITLSGTGLSLTSDVVFRMIDSSGNEYQRVVAPIAAAADGTTAEFVLPEYYNGAFNVRVVGSAQARLLQIVPTVTLLGLSGDQLQLFGRGFVEDGTTYAFAGLNLADSDGAIDVSAWAYGNDVAYFNNLPNFGFGNLTVTSAGGTSAPLTLDLLRHTAGTAYDTAFDSLNGQVLIAAANSILRLDPTTGATVASFARPDTSGEVGLHVLAQAMTLGGVNVPAGSLLYASSSQGNQILAPNIPNKAHAQLDKSQAITLRLSELCKRVYKRHMS